MFQNGDYVIYGCKGIHRILDTTHLSLDGVSKDRLYYVMQPLSKPEGSVYAPVDASKTTMRATMSRDGAHSFLRQISDIPVLDIKNNKQREDAYKECIRSAVPAEVMRVIKSLERRKAERKQAGKKLTISDMHYLEQAENILYDELSLALEVPKAEIPGMIHDILADTAV